MEYYTGIGSRKTPKDVLGQMEIWARYLFEIGYCLRSGGAPGADQAFERGLASVNSEIVNIRQHAQIFLPWASFELPNRTWIPATLDEPQSEAYVIAAQYHPKWKHLKFSAKKFHARNVHQILGPDLLNPIQSKFVMCWTKGGKEVGGTAQAIRIANDLNIPVFNLGGTYDIKKLLRLL